MRVRRVIAASTVAVLAGGAALLLSAQGSSAATPTPTPVYLSLVNTLTGMSSPACPLPLNGSMAVPPGTSIKFMPSKVTSENLTITPNPTDPKSAAPKKIDGIDKNGVVVAFPKGGTFKLSWQASVLLGSLSNTGTLVVDARAQKCTIAVQLPQPSVSVPGAGPVNSIVNGVVAPVVSAVNSAVAPVNSAVGPILGSVNSGVGGVTGGGSSGGTAGSGGHSAGGPSLGTIYTPSDLTPAQRTVPQGGGAGGGGGGASSQDGSSINAPALGFKGTGTGTAPAHNLKSGGSPSTVELAADKPKSALDGWANLIVVAAVLALSGATAFYARTYLLHPLPARVKPGS